MRVSLVTLIAGPAGEDTIERLFIITGISTVLDVKGYDAYEVWANPAEPAMWLVDDEPTWIRFDRIWANGMAIREVGIVKHVTLSVTHPSLIRRASEINR